MATPTATCLLPPLILGYISSPNFLHAREAPIQQQPTESPGTYSTARSRYIRLGVGPRLYFAFVDQASLFRPYAHCHRDELVTLCHFMHEHSFRLVKLHEPKRLNVE